MNAGTMGYEGTGRIVTTTAAPNFNHIAPNAIPFSVSGLLCVGVEVQPRSFVSGIPYGITGRISITLVNPIARHVGGIPMGASGRICCDTSSPIVRHVRGIPICDNGRVAIVVPVAGALGIGDLDADENPDTVLLDLPAGPDVTEDVDSINIDLDGDGDAEIVIPKP